MRQDWAWSCSGRWGASRRWPFDLPTNGLFSISKTGPPSVSQAGKVGKHTGIVCGAPEPRIFSATWTRRAGAARFSQRLGWPPAKDSLDGLQGRPWGREVQASLPAFAGPGAGVGVWDRSGDGWGPEEGGRCGVCAEIQGRHTPGLAALPCSPWDRWDFPSSAGAFFFFFLWVKALCPEWQDLMALTQDKLPAPPCLPLPLKLKPTTGGNFRGFF